MQERGGAYRPRRGWTARRGARARLHPRARRPHATRMLTDLGADVIKVEPPAGDLTRFANPRVNGLSTYFVQQNVGKRNVSIDLGDPRGIELALRLAEHCDVLTENYRPGVMDRLGLGPATVVGPQPAAGLRLDQRIRGHRPVGAPPGLRAGRRRRDRADEGPGRRPRRDLRQRPPQPRRRLHVARGDGRDPRRAVPARAHRARPADRDLDGRDDALRQRAPPRPALRRSGRRAVDPQLLARRLPRRSRSPTARSSIVSGHPAERGTFELFLGALGLEHLRDDPRFVDVAVRMAHFDELRDTSARRRREIPDAPTFEEQFAKHRLASGVLRSARELAESEWAAARGAIVEVSDRGGGTIRVPNVAVAVRRRRRRRQRPAEVPRRGQPRRAGRASSGTTTPRSTRWRPTACSRRRLPASRGDALVPGRADAGDLGRLPTDDSALGVRGQVGRLPHARLHRVGRVRLQSSNLYDVTAKYPELARSATATGARRAVLDGELVVLDDDGRPRFELIQRHAIEKREAAFYVFDVLSIDDHDTISLPYEDRRRLLAEVVESGPNWTVPAHRVGDGQALLDATAERGLEGVMAKRLGSTYRPGHRTKEWRKVKHRQQGRGRHRRLHRGHGKPHLELRGPARRALGRRLARLRRRRRHRVHPAPP